MLEWPVDLILEGEIPECDVVVLGRPVNPTCQVIEIEEIKKIAKCLRDQGGWLILDEAYIDWTGEESYASFIEAVPAIVLRSMAPFSGLAGSNLAFVCAPKEVCTALLNEVGTQAVSAAQWWLALQYFNAEKWRAEQTRTLAQSVSRLEALWRTKLGQEVAMDLGGYFVSFVHENNQEWANQMETHGVLLRTYQTDVCIVRCAIPRDEMGWMRLAHAIDCLNQSLD